MDLWLVYVFFALGVAALYLIIRISALFQAKKSIFHEPTNHVEIRYWRLKKPN